MIPLSKADKSRLTHINSLMEVLYDNLDNLYEALVDKEIEQSRKIIKEHMESCKSLSDSLRETF